MGWAPKWVGVSGGVAAPGTSITSIARFPQHLDLFCVGSDDGIYSTWWDISTAAGGWANWFRVAGGVAAPGTTITVVARNPNHLDLFAVGSDHGIYSIWWDANGGWAGSWFRISNLTAAPNTSVAALARNPNHLDLFAVGSDHGIYSIWWDASTGWASWFQVQGGFAAPNTSVNALSRYPDILDVFVVGTDQHIDTIWWLDELYFSMQHQQQSNWCWAATATSEGLFYQQGSGWTQCTVANDELRRTDYCGSGASGACNVYGFLNQALTVVGRLDHYGSGVASVAQIETEVTFARPLGIRVAWSGGGAHFLCIMGQYNVGGVDYVTVDDPIYGRSNLPYTTLQTAYQ